MIEREGEKLKKEFKDLKKGDEKVGNLRNLEFQQDVLLEFLKNNCEFNDVVIQRLASFAYMDGSLIYYDELARCIDEVLITKARKRKFAEIYLGWSLEQFEKLLAEPEEHVGDFENDKCFAWIIEYLQSKSEDRVKLVVLPDVSEDDTDQAHGEIRKGIRELRIDFQVPLLLQLARLQQIMLQWALLQLTLPQLTMLQ